MKKIILSQVRAEMAGNVESLSLERALDDNMAHVRKKRCTLDEGDILQKLKYSEPYRFFLSSIAANPKTYNGEMHTISFPEIFDQKLGAIESSLQLTFKVDVEWLLAQYAVNNEKSTPITLLHGYKNPDGSELFKMNSSFPNVQTTCIQPSTMKMSRHHTKMMILSYVDGSIRVVVTTGNLIKRDWENTTHGIWISPRLPRIESGPTGADVSDSETHFKKDLLDYLEEYNTPVMKPWIQKVKNADCKEVKVFFIASAYGAHQLNAPVKWGLVRLAQLLSEHAIVPEEDAKNSPLYYQPSSFGMLGQDPSEFLLDVFTRALQSSVNHSSCNPEVKLIYPCYEDVVGSYDGEEAGRCLTYSKYDHEKQWWLNNYLCKWRSNSCHRTRAMPQINTYCRLSPCKKYLSWFLLTSANLSKAAWGRVHKPETQKYGLRNYEAGVLFIPQYLIAKSRLPLTDQSPAEDGPKFSLPYDIPLLNYDEEDDEPWTINHLLKRGPYLS